MTVDVGSVERKKVREQNQGRNIHLWETNVMEMLAKEIQKFRDLERDSPKSRRKLRSLMC